MLILLTHANHMWTDRKQVKKMQPYPPLQTLIAANVLRRDGHDVAFLDTTFDRNFHAALDRVQPDMVAVCEDNFNFLTKMCLLENRNLAIEIAQELKIPNTYFTHLSHQMGKHEDVSKELPKGIHLATDGLVLEF